MKNIVAPLILILLFVQCSIDSDPQDNLDTVNVVSQMVIPEYTPNPELDNSSNGIYHGILIGQTGTQRHKIWINMNNDSSYSAKIFLTDDSIIDIYGTIDDNVVTFDNGIISFKAIYQDEEVLFTDVFFNESPYFIYAPKQSSQRMMFPFTGTYEFDNSATNGTWTVFMDSNQADPNGAFFGGFGMADVVVSAGGTMLIDNAHENANYPCEGISSWVPTIRISSFGDPNNPILVNEMFVPTQASDFNGVTSWSIFHAGGIGYFDADCNNLASGVFSRTNPTTGMTQTGTIFIDF